MLSKCCIRSSGSEILTKDGLDIDFLTVHNELAEAFTRSFLVLAATVSLLLTYEVETFKMPEPEVYYDEAYDYYGTYDIFTDEEISEMKEGYDNAVIATHA